jgi:tRNA pseudouridine13 synthase
MWESQSFLTTEFPGIGGVIKACDEDFFVEEQPLYEPCGSGTHTYLLMEKQGMGTREALSAIARALSIRHRDIGYAGLKDAHAVTRQWISIEHIPWERIESLSIPQIRILKIMRHTNKLKPGHLAGNRFVIRLRRPGLSLEQAAITAKQVLAVLGKKGVPNFFGVQRFGLLGTNHLLGRAVVFNQAETYMDLFLGRAQEMTDIVEARALYDRGDYQNALGAWPQNSIDQRRTLGLLIKAGGKKNKAFKRVDKRLKSFFVSAYQSWLFNRVLAMRMPDIDRILQGDMAYKHSHGACFSVEDAQLEQPRCDRFEISPTGPLLGQRTVRLTGPAGAIENPILDEEELGEEEFKRMQTFGAPGGRRPLRFQPRHTDVAIGSNQDGSYLMIRFELDAGCYATTVMAEIMKNDPSQDDRK